MTAMGPDCVKTPIYAKYGLHKAICQVMGLLFIDYFVFGFILQKLKVQLSADKSINPFEEFLSATKRRLLCPQCLYESRSAHDIHDPLQIIGKHMQAHFCTDLI